MAGHAVADKIHLGLRHVNVNAKFVEPGHAHDRRRRSARARRSLHRSRRALAAAGMNQCPGINETLSDHPVEWSDYSCIALHRAQLIDIRLCFLKLAIGDVYVLTGNQARIALPYRLQSLVAETLNFQVGLGTRQLLIEFRHFDDRQYLAGPHHISLIDENSLQIASNL